MESQVPVKVSVKIFPFGIPNPLRKLHAFRVLGGHIYQNVGRNAVFLIGKPFDGACVGKRRYPDRLSPIVYLRIVAGNLKLGNHIHHASHLSVSQKGSGILVQERDCFIVNLLDIIGEFSFFNRQKPLVLRRIKKGRG